MVVLVGKFVAPSIGFVFVVVSRFDSQDPHGNCVDQETQDSHQQRLIKGYWHGSNQSFHAFPGHQQREDRSAELLQCNRPTN